MEFFQCVPMGPDGGAPGASGANVRDAQGFCACCWRVKAKLRVYTPEKNAQ